MFPHAIQIVPSRANNLYTVAPRDMAINGVVIKSNHFYKDAKDLGVYITGVTAEYPPK